jgi:predicted nucleic acid-binding protein
MPSERGVSDTSTVSNLALIGRLDLLARLHGTVIIPPAVHEELMRLRQAAARLAIEAALAEGRLRIEPPTSVVGSAPQLHAGESECLALAMDSLPTLLLMDEAEGRRVARRHGIALSGVVGVLIAARRRDWIPSLKAELLALRTTARFFIAPSLFEQALAEVGETMTDPSPSRDPELIPPKGARGKRFSAHEGRVLITFHFTGGCACEAVPYESSAAPILMFKCHCRDCQRVTGGGHVPALLVPTSAFRLTKGELRYHFTPSLAGGQHKRGFCPECGSRLTGGEFDEQPKNSVGITAGSLDHRAWFRPTMEIFT